MGLFDLFKKKDKPAAPAASVSVKIEARTVEVEVVQRTPGELPLADVGGYVSPSGGFVNFGRFKVAGTNATTGRRNTKRYEVQTEGEARAAAAADGLVEPMVVEAEPNEGPTEQQMAYALDLKAAIPAGACKADVSAIISRITDEDEAAPDPGLSQWAHDCGVRFSRFVGHDALLGYMAHQLQGVDAGTLYAYAVYLQEKGGSFSDPRRLPVYGGLRRCGEAVAADPSLMKSLEGRDADDLRRPNRGTKVYKATAELLKAQQVL